MNQLPKKIPPGCYDVALVKEMINGQSKWEISTGAYKGEFLFMPAMQFGDTIKIKSTHLKGENKNGKIRTSI